MPRPKWTAQQIEIAVAEYFNVRTKIIVPNVSFGLFKYHEADLIILYPSDWCSEVEIKVTAQDIKQDLSKKHDHSEKNIRKLWFAVPEELSSHPDIPEKAGILIVSRYVWRGKKRYRVEAKRLPKRDKFARKFTAEERMKLLRLGCLRIFGLKQKLDEKQNIIEELKAQLKSGKGATDEL